MPKTETTYRPEQLAEALGVSGKQIRAFCRSNFPRSADAKGTTWVLSRAQAKQVKQHFESRQSPDEDES